MASLKPEVVLTLATYLLEKKFYRLGLCFKGWPTQWHIDRGQLSNMEAEKQDGGQVPYIPCN